MKKYSDFFQTLHDEQGPTGYLGRGTHYSVLRAVVFHDATGRHLPKAQFADFAVIWDEDHDDRVMEPIERIYRYGLLPRFLMFGERKGGFTAVLANEIKDQSQLSCLHGSLNKITQQLDNGDAWSTRVVDIENPDHSIIDASADKVVLYLKNLAMLWDLGVKVPPKEAPLSSLLLQKTADLDLSVRTQSCLNNANIIYVGELVQKSEAEMLRTPIFARKSLNEIKEALNQMGLHLGMDLPDWPPQDLEGPVKRFEEVSAGAGAELG